MPFRENAEAWHAAQKNSMLWYVKSRPDRSLIPPFAFVRHAKTIRNLGILDSPPLKLNANASFSPIRTSGCA